MMEANAVTLTPSPHSPGLAISSARSLNCYASWGERVEAGRRCILIELRCLSSCLLIIILIILIIILIILFKWRISWRLKPKVRFMSSLVALPIHTIMHDKHAYQEYWLYAY